MDLKFQKFKIVSFNNSERKEELVDILINIDHIISIKPIRMVNSKKMIIEGHWLRLSNGKKYKAVQISEDLKALFSAKLPAPRLMNDEQFEIIQ